MSIRKIWLSVLLLTVIISIAINAALMTALTDRSFQAYLEENYATHLEEIQQYAQAALKNDSVSPDQLRLELETHLVDPIIGIRLMDPSGFLTLEVENDAYLSKDWQTGSMMEQMMYRIMQSGQEETRTIELLAEGRPVGSLQIIQHSSTAQSMLARMFKASLWRNSLISIFIAMIMAGLIGSLISQRMSRSLQETAEYAHRIQLDEAGEIEPSRIREVNEIRSSLNHLLVRLKLRQKSRKELTDQMMHQSRTPLTILKSHLEALEDGLVQGSPEEYEILNQQLDSLTMLLAGLNHVLDSQGEPEKFHYKAVELEPILRQIMAGIQRQFDQKGIQLELDCGSIRLVTDPHKLSQVIYNLLNNAYKYSEKNARVKISCRSEEGSVWITVADSGRGISPGDLARIFDAYYRSPDVAGIQGEGIGLYLARQSLASMGGSITATSVKGEGSRFLIHLPMEGPSNVTEPASPSTEGEA